MRSSRGTEQYVSEGHGGGGSHAETINNQMESGYIEFDQGKGDKGEGGGDALPPPVAQLVQTPAQSWAKVLLKTG